VTEPGAIIMSVFAAIWWIAGARASHYSPAITFVVPLVIAGTIVIFAWRRSSSQNSVPAPERNGRVVGISSAVEGVLILVAVNVLNNTGHSDWTAPAIAIIVGLHFLPIARWWPATLYYLTGALLVALGAIGLALPAGRTRTMVVAVGAACILWLTSAEVLRRLPKASFGSLA
jgi:nicotinamide riboside transporter PnuC